MTNREFLNTIAELENIPVEITEYAKNAIAKLDATNEKRKNNPSKKETEKKQENEQLASAILAVMTTEAVTESTIAELVGISGPKARAILRQLVNEGKIVKTEAKLPKKGVCKVYALAE